MKCTFHLISEACFLFFLFFPAWKVQLIQRRGSVDHAFALVAGSANTAQAEFRQLGEVAFHSRLRSSPPFIWFRPSGKVHAEARGFSSDRQLSAE